MPLPRTHGVRLEEVFQLFKPSKKCSRSRKKCATLTSPTSEKIGNYVPIERSNLLQKHVKHK